jgi:peptidoglycan/LPS O-acetylase OafA/YrhL
VSAPTPTTTTTPAAKAPPRERFTGLEGLRAVGIIAVFLTHSAFITGTTFGSKWNVHLGPVSGRPASLLGHLEIGPAIFFMISAFLLYRPFLMASFHGTAPPSTRRFLRRRFIRVFPAYWATLILMFALGWIHTETKLQLFRVITLTQIYTHKGFFGIDVLVPTWTLATEVTFYVFIVVWAPCMRRVTVRCDPRARLQRELVGAFALAVFAFLFRVAVYHGVARLPDVAEHWLPGTLDLFAVGMAFAAVDVYARTRGGPPRLSPLVADLCVVAAVFWFFAVPLFTNASEGIAYSTGWDAYGRDLFQLMCSAFLLAPVTFVGSSGGLYRRLMATKPLAYIGLVSYGIYLWHDAWIVRAVHWSGGFVALKAPFWTVGVSAFSLSVVMGALSWHFLERPVLELEAGRRPFSGGPATARPLSNNTAAPASPPPTVSVAP